MIQSRQLQECRTLIEVDGAAPATLVNGQYHASLAVNGVGDYTVTMTEGARRTLVVLASALEADTAIAIAARTTTSFQVLVTDLAGAAKDGDIALDVISWASADET